MIYGILSRLFPTKPPPAMPQRIVLIRPCCIGDVVMATGAAHALRQHFPDAHITWAVGGWSAQVVELLRTDGTINTILDTGSRDLPVRSLGGFWRFVRDLRAGQYDLAVSLVRSPLMSLAVALAGIPHRVGLDSVGRGFGYTVRVPIDPSRMRHEAEIYLDVVQALGATIDGVYPQINGHEYEAGTVRDLLRARGITGAYIVVNPNGGNNPGMMMDMKRYPPELFAQLADNLAEALGCAIVLLGGAGDAKRVNAVGSAMRHRPVVFIGQLSFAQIASLAQQARLYIGNDTGLTHLSAAAGGKTAMILGPTSPERYAPYTPSGQRVVLWKPTTVNAGGVSAGSPDHWSWAQDGISVEDATAQILEFLDVE